MDFKSADEQADMLMDMTKGVGISLFAECAGATKFTYPVMGKALAIGGKTIQIGHTLGITPVDIFNWQWNAATISGSNGQSGQGIYPDVIALMASGRIDMRKMLQAATIYERHRGRHENHRGKVPGSAQSNPKR